MLVVANSERIPGPMLLVPGSGPPTLERVARAHTHTVTITRLDIKFFQIPLPSTRHTPSPKGIVGGIADSRQSTDPRRIGCIIGQVFFQCLILNTDSQNSLAPQPAEHLEAVERLLFFKSVVYQRMPGTLG